MASLIRALSAFDGGVLLVSHDEHFITALCDELWIIGDKRVVSSRGNFQDYKRKVLKKKA